MTLANIDPASAQAVIAHADAYGEHSITVVTVYGAAVPVDGRWLRIDFAPGPVAELRLGMKRIAHRPGYETPFADPVATGTIRPREP